VHDEIRQWLYDVGNSVKQVLATIGKYRRIASGKEVVSDRIQCYRGDTK